VFPEYVVKIVDGFRVGIFGLTTPTTKYKTMPAGVANVTFDSDLVSISTRVVAKLGKDEKCEIVILVRHLGWGWEAVDIYRDMFA
jgi:5'-nucleotidase